MAQVNAINNKVTELTLDPGASGDSFVQFDINATGEFRIGVDDTDDSFRISQGSALGTNDTLIMTAAGEMTLPLQPAFLAYNSVVDTDVTGNSVTFTLIFDTEVYDQNGDFDGTSTFTAPVTGRYLFASTILCDDVTGSFTTMQFQLNGSNRNVLGELNVGGGLQDSAGQLSCSVSANLDMDAADVAVVDVIFVASTQTVDIVGDATPSTWFSGQLIE